MAGDRFCRKCGRLTEKLFCSDCKKAAGFHLTPEWLAVRDEVLEYYGPSCMKCGFVGSPHIDHIKPKSKYPELRLAFHNLQVLCHKCNFRKGSHAEDDYRPRLLLV